MFMDILPGPHNLKGLVEGHNMVLRLMLQLGLGLLEEILGLVS